MRENNEVGRPEVVTSDDVIGSDFKCTKSSESVT